MHTTVILPPALIMPRRDFIIKLDLPNYVKLVYLRDVLVTAGKTAGKVLRETESSAVSRCMSCKDGNIPESEEVCPGLVKNP